MNIIRDGILLAVYTFVIILAYIFLSTPFTMIISGVAAAGADNPHMAAMQNEINTVFSIATAMAVLIPTIIFIWMAFTTRNEEYPWG
jgi:hypothetical protein